MILIQGFPPFSGHLLLTRLAPARRWQRDGGRLVSGFPGPPLIPSGFLDNEPEAFSGPSEPIGGVPAGSALAKNLRHEHGPVQDETEEPSVNLLGLANHRGRAHRGTWARRKRDRDHSGRHVRTRRGGPVCRDSRSGATLGRGELEPRPRIVRRRTSRRRLRLGEDGIGADRSAIGGLRKDSRRWGTRRVTRSQSPFAHGTRSVSRDKGPAPWTRLPSSGMEESEHLERQFRS